MTAIEHAHALYMEGIRDGDAEGAIARHAGERYTQHSHPVPDGKDGFLAFFTAFRAAHPDRDIVIHRSFQQGRKVFLHVHQILDGGATQWVTMDIFDSDEHGRLIEHWDVIQEWADPTASGRTMIDGPTTPTDLDDTDQNTALVRDFLETVVLGGDLGRLGEFVADDVAQHSPSIADGRDAWAERLAVTKGVAVHQVVGEGSFVATLSHLVIDGVSSAAKALHRVDRGMIVEHWDVVEAIVPESEWVNSGKF